MTASPKETSLLEALKLWHRWMNTPSEPYPSPTFAAAMKATNLILGEEPGKKEKILQTCGNSACGALFHADPWIVARGGGKFCSRPCYVAGMSGKRKAPK